MSTVVAHCSEEFQKIGHAEPQCYITVVPKRMCHEKTDSASEPVMSDCTGGKREETGNRTRQSRFATRHKRAGQRIIP